MSARAGGLQPPSVGYCLLKCVGAKARMKSRTKLAIGIAGALCCLGILVISPYVQLVLLSSQDESAREIPVTKEYADAMRAAGFPITVQRMFEASSYGGWHGDGSELTAYRYPPRESASLIEALKRKAPDFVWTESRRGAGALDFSGKLLPQDFLPDTDSVVLLVGRPSKGLPMNEYVVDRSRGILYCVSHRF